MLDVLKHLFINIPLVEALEKMLNYAKAIKEFLFKKRRFGKLETVALTIECSLFFQNKLPLKLKDLGSFIIPSNIGESYCDFEADKEVSIILRRPFQETDRTKIDVQKGEPTIQVQEKQVTFNVLKALRSPDMVKDCFTISEEDSLVPIKLEYNDPLEGISSDSLHQDEDDKCLEASVLLTASVAAIFTALSRPVYGVEPSC
ncbi:uncharacterized protein [Gossypium hirsutum]|uniref:Uncharacterized protein n=1 Tax=Gossypium hirsutum TaxID=3635 RepID=A0ABM3BWA9_GOSHI|nr:uncharacterized protein LOC121230509 [Gossypium hirsutum]